MKPQLTIRDWMWLVAVIFLAMGAANSEFRSRSLRDSVDGRFNAVDDRLDESDGNGSRELHRHATWIMDVTKRADDNHTLILQMQGIIANHQRQFDRANEMLRDNGYPALADDGQ